MYHNRSKVAVSLVVTAVCAALIAQDACKKHWQAEMIASIQKGNLQQVERALDWGADPNCVTGESTAEVAGAEQSAMTFAVWQGSPDIVEALVKAGGYVNGPDPEGRTPLVTAIYNRDDRMCAALLRLGADPKQPGADPFNSTVIKTPMEAFVFETDVLAHSRRPKQTLFGIYQLLRSRGVVPTQAQAISIGDNDEAIALVAREQEASHKGASRNSGLYAGAPKPDETHGKELDGSESNSSLGVNFGI